MLATLVRDLRCCVGKELQHENVNCFHWISLCKLSGNIIHMLCFEAKLFCDGTANLCNVFLFTG